MRRFYSLLLLALTWSCASAQITLTPGTDPRVALPATVLPGEFMSPEISTDLVTWQTLAPRPVDPDGLLRFTDLGGQTQLRRFYRAVAATPPPTGTWLIYERRTPAGISIIYRCRLGGTEETALVVGRYPRPSPSGRWILLTRDGTGPSGHSGADVYAYDTTTNPGANNPRLVYNNPTSYDIVNYCFKHDNFQFVFDYGSGADGRIYTLNTNGGNPAVYPSGDCQEAMPSFNPDDSTLVFAHRIPSQLATRTGGVKQALTPAGFGDSWPQWSPDGVRIAACDGNTDFSRTDLGHDLLLVDPSTGARTPLTQLTEPGDGFPYGGAWSANSLWIFAAGTVNGIQGMWRVPIAGGGPQMVPITSAFDIAPGISTSPVVFVGGIVP